MLKNIPHSNSQFTIQCSKKLDSESKSITHAEKSSPFKFETHILHNYNLIKLNTYLFNHFLYFPKRSAQGLHRTPVQNSTHDVCRERLNIECVLCRLYLASNAVFVSEQRRFSDTVKTTAISFRLLAVTRIWKDYDPRRYLPAVAVINDHRM